MGKVLFKIFFICPTLSIPIPPLKKNDFTFENEVNKLTELCQQDLVSVNTIILDKLDSNVPLVQEVAKYLILSGGKRLRPLLTVSSHHMINNGKIKKENHINHIGLAAAVEFIHAATLLHDDVIDESKKRRGKPTANEKWKNKTSVLVGDFLFSRSFQLMTKYGNSHTLKILADTKTDEILGAHIIGHDAGQLIAEIVTTMEFGGSSEDIARICHAHPTTSEAVKEAAMNIEGRAIHI